MSLQSTITNKVLDPTGAALVGISAVIRLVPPGGFRIDDHNEVDPQVTVVTDGTGTWTASLERTSNITPAGSYYAATELVPALQGGPRTWAFTVGAVNATLQASLFTVPVS